MIRNAVFLFIRQDKKEKHFKVIWKSKDLSSLLIIYTLNRWDMIYCYHKKVDIADYNFFLFTVKYLTYGKKKHNYVVGWSGRFRSWYSCKDELSAWKLIEPSELDKLRSFKLTLWEVIDQRIIKLKKKELQVWWSTATNWL